MKTRLRKAVLGGQLILIALFSAAFVSAQAGAVDPAFNPGAIFVRSTFPEIKITRTVAQADGKVLIGGFFSAAGKTNTFGVARLNTDGTLDTSFRVPLIGTASLGQGITYYTLAALAVQPDGKILIGGSFSSIGGVARYGFARLNSDGSLDTTFDFVFGANGSTANYISDIKITADNKIIVVGNISYNFGGSGKYIARLNSNGTLDTTFNSAPAVSNLNGGYIAQPLPDGKILFAASSVSQGAVIYRLNADGTRDTSFSTIVTGTVNAITLLGDGKFYVGGDFAQVNGFTLRNLARFNADGTVDTNFNAGNTGPNFAVRKIELQSNGQLIIGGSFSTYNGFGRNYIALINADGNLDSTFNISLPGGILDYARLPDGKFVLGRQTNNYDNSIALSIINADGTLAANQTVIGEIPRVNRVFVQPDGRVLIGGTFTHVDNRPSSSLARVNADGTADVNFLPPNLETVYSIDVRADGKILVGTIYGVYRFGSIGSQEFVLGLGATLDAKFLPGGGFITSANQRIRKFAENGNSVPIFNILLSANANRVLVQPDGKFIIAGEFLSVAGTDRGRIARLNADGSLDTTFNPAGANSSIFDAVLQPDGKIIIGGNFTGVNFNTNYKNLARLNADGSLDTTFNPVIEGGVQSLKLQPDGKILIGGGFYAVGGVPRNRIARVNQDGSLDPTFNTGAGADDAVLSIDLQQNGVIIGGWFPRVGNLDRLGVARLSNTTATARTKFDFDGDGKADLSVFRPSAGAWFVQRSNAGFAAYNFGTAGDVIAPADYDGDGQTDLAVYRSGVWYLQRSSLGFTSVQFGLANDLVVPADYDADGKADLAVYRSGIWYVLNSSNGQVAATAFGLSDDKPTIGDFDGDGKSDIAVFRPSNGVWYRLTASNQTIGTQFGAANDLVVPADYDADGKTDLAVYRSGVWYLQRSSLGFTGIQFGAAGDKPVAADYDGDGRADIAVFRPSNGVWYLNRSTQGFTGIQFGAVEDLPAPNAFVR